MPYLNWEAINGVSPEAFHGQKPYPWVNIPGTFTQEGFERLRETLPDISIFERHVGKKRAYGQASHDRAMLHYQAHLDLAQPWKEFIAELHGEPYQSFLRRMLALPLGKPVILTMNWHYAWQGCSVSPHCDARRKVATHSFFLNGEADWEASWGGQFLVMDDDGRLKAHSAPSFDDLKVSAAVDTRGISSLLFQRTEHSWHGVRPLLCPPGALRKMFFITVNLPTLQLWWRRLRGKDADGYSLQAP